MELDDFKNSLTEQKSPEFTGDKINMQPMETFIEELKAFDSKERLKIRTFILIFGMFVLIYSGRLFEHPGEMKTGFSLIVLGFALAIVYFYWGFRKIRKVDYFSPTTVFLAEAEQRYRYMKPSDWLVVIPLLIIFITGGGMVVQASFERYFGDSLVPLFIYLGIMLITVAFGSWAGYKNWKGNKGRMLEKIRAMKIEFGI